MAYLAQALLCALGTLFTYGLISAYGIVKLRWTSPLLLLPGPKSKSALWGSSKEMRGSDNQIEVHNAWFREQ